MAKHLVSIVRYEKPFYSVRKAVFDCDGFKSLKPGARVFIKPNIVFWPKSPFPKWGVITTSRVIEDTVLLLKDYGIEDITIGEGIVTGPADTETAARAFESLGYQTLQERYGIKSINIMKRPFREVDLGEGIKLNFNLDLLESDFLVNIPVLKTHNQTVVSLGIKNLKGTINLASRKRCHNPDPRKDLHFHITRLADPMPPTLTIIDGIFSLERGPAFDGRARRTDLLVASNDILSADLVGAKLLGYEPEQVSHLQQAAEKTGRPLDLSDLDLVGEKIEDAASYHEYDFVYVRDKNNEMPRALARQGLQGLLYRKFDDTMCTYCSNLNGVILTAIRQAWQGKPWNNVEVLTGKRMEPSPGMGATLLIGRCMYDRNKNHPNIQNLYAAKGCPPDPPDIVSAFNRAGIAIESTLFSQMDDLPAFFLSRYRDDPDFDESFYHVDQQGGIS